VIRIVVRIHDRPDNSLDPETATSAARGSIALRRLDADDPGNTDLHPPRSCPLSPASPFRAVVIGGFADHHYSHKKTAVESFIVTG
jgi:hypothetical protein